MNLLFASSGQERFERLCQPTDQGIWVLKKNKKFSKKEIFKNGISKKFLFEENQILKSNTSQTIWTWTVDRLSWREERNQIIYSTSKTEHKENDIISQRTICLFRASIVFTIRRLIRGKIFLCFWLFFKSFYITQ